MTGIELKTEAESEEFAGELSDEALDRVIERACVACSPGPPACVGCGCDLS